MRLGVEVVVVVELGSVATAGHASATASESTERTPANGPRTAPTRAESQAIPDTFVESSAGGGAAPPPAHAPLDDAFVRSGTGMSAKPLAAVLRDPVSPGGLEEAFERAIVERHGAALVPYVEVRRGLPVAVLVHGINSGGEDLELLARTLHEAGRQVYVFCYDDRGERTPLTGRRLAAAMMQLERETRGAPRELQLIGHSKGGLVARVALNELQRMLHDGAGGTLLPRAGFSTIQFTAVDTPWDGFAHEPTWLTRLQEPLLTGVMAVLGLQGAQDLRASSAMFAGLYATRLDDVTTSVIAARQLPLEADGIRSIHDLAPRELRALVRFACHGTEPPTLRVRNLALGVAQDERWPRVQAELAPLATRAALDGPESESDVEWVTSVLQAFERHMPSIAATHSDIIQQPELFERLLRPR